MPYISTLRGYLLHASVRQSVVMGFILYGLGERRRTVKCRATARRHWHYAFSNIYFHLYRNLFAALMLLFDLMPSSFFPFSDADTYRRMMIELSSIYGDIYSRDAVSQKRILSASTHFWRE